MKTKKIYLLFAKELYNLPTPSSISYFWNFGVLLGVCLLTQLVTGLFLSFHYTASISTAFSSVIHIMNDVNNGWFIRFLHANMASMFFVLVFCHVGRGLYYNGPANYSAWLVGVVILLLLMMIAFMGYVLPWGQMSFWGATVITNLLSAIPYFGDSLVKWVWGGFSVSEPTLTRIYSLHFIIPFFLVILVAIHLMALHSSGSSNPLGVYLDSDKVSFHPFFSVKDLMSVVVFFILVMSLILQVPDLFMDPDNFIMANPLNTPPHIQPEWYFLFAYCILRSVPSKLGGVIALFMSVGVLMIPSLFKLKSGKFNFPMKTCIVLLITDFIFLTWLGKMPVMSPYLTLSQICSFTYFLLFMVMILLPKVKLWGKK